MKKVEKENIDETNHIIDESPDHNNFVQVPLVVILLSRDPYDVVFWMTIKQIAWKEGSECYLSTADLAILSMMSISKASDCRNYLIEVGLLNGRLEQIPGSKMKSIWHISIPPLWGLNENMMRGIKGWKSRIEYKREQADALKEQRNDKKSKVNSPDENGSDSNSLEKFDSNIPGAFASDSNSPEKFGIVPEKFGSIPGNDNIDISLTRLNKQIEEKQLKPFDPNSVWKSIQAQIEMSINKVNYRNYVKDLQVKGWDGYTLVVTTSIPINVEWLNQKVEKMASRLLQSEIQNSQAGVRFELGFPTMTK
jgi:hypothetical protein